MWSRLTRGGDGLPREKVDAIVRLIDHYLAEEASLTWSMSALLTYPITPRSLKRLVIEPRVMPWAVLRPAMTAPCTSRDGLKSSEMYLVYREYLKLWACSRNRPPMLRATAPSQRMSWLPGMTT